MALETDGSIYPTLQAELVNQYAAYYDVSAFFSVISLTVARLSPLARLTASRVLKACAVAIGTIISEDRGSLLAPQLIILQTLAQNCRDMSIACRRYAGNSRGSMGLRLTPTALAILATFERYDPARDAVVLGDPQRDIVIMLEDLEAM